MAPIATVLVDGEPREVLSLGTLPTELHARLVESRTALLRLAGTARASLPRGDMEGQSTLDRALAAALAAISVLATAAHPDVVARRHPVSVTSVPTGGVVP